MNIRGFVNFGLSVIFGAVAVATLLVLHHILISFRDISSGSQPEENGQFLLVLFVLLGIGQAGLTRLGPKLGSRFALTLENKLAPVKKPRDRAELDQSSRSILTMMFAVEQILIIGVLASLGNSVVFFAFQVALGWLPASRLAHVLLAQKFGDRMTSRGDRRVGLVIGLTFIATSTSILILFLNPARYWTGEVFLNLFALHRILAMQIRLTQLAAKTSHR